MKLCLACQSGFESIHWMCPQCQTEPAMIKGYHAFSPELALANDGMEMDSHHMLNDLQDKSFWFRIRNKLIQDVIQREFQNAVRVMEIGCGTGYVLDGIRSVLPNAKLTATEIYSDALTYASQRISQPTEFLQVDAMQLPFKQEFDLVGSFDVLEHIDNDEQVIQNIKQSLREGGGVIFTVPQHPWLWSQADDQAHHKRRYTRHELSSLLERNGFEIKLDTSFMFFLLPVMFLKRLVSSKKATYSLEKELVLPRWLDKIFEWSLRVERVAIKYGIRYPIGGSRLVVAKLKTTVFKNN